MNSFLKSIVLTAVVLTINSAWAADSKETKTAPAKTTPDKTAQTKNSSAKSATIKAAPVKIESSASGQNTTVACAEFKAIKSDAEANLNRVTGDSETAAYKSAERAYTDALADYKDCLTTKKSSCTELNSQLSAITKDFPQSSMQEAVNCYSADEESLDGGKMTMAVMYAAANQVMPGQKTCRISGTKNNFSSQLDDYDKKIEKYTDEMGKQNKELVQESKDLNKTLKQIEDARLEIQEKLQELAPTAKSKQDEALQKMQENQDKISRSIRELNTALIKARQDEQSLNTKLQAELQAKQVHSESSIQRTCEVGLQEYYDKRYGKKKGKSGNLATASTKGARKKADVQAAFNDCVSAQRKIRASIYEAATQSAVLAADNISKMEADIANLEKQYKSQVEQYNKFLENLNTTISNQQKALLAKDQKLANEALQAQQESQQEVARINSEKLLLQQKLQAAHNSQGQISEKEVEEGTEKYQEVDRITTELETNCGRMKRSDSAMKRVQENIDKINERSSDSNQ